MSGQTDHLRNEKDLLSFIDELKGKIKITHADCSCDQCLYDRLVILGLAHAQELFHSQIILIENHRSPAAVILARSMAELVIDILFIRLDLNTRIRNYLALADSFQIFRLEHDKERLIQEGKSVKEIEEYIKVLEENLQKDSLPVLRNPKSWTDLNLPDRVHEILGVNMYSARIMSSLKGREYDIRCLHGATHCNSIQMSKRYSHAKYPENRKEAIELSLDWIMILLDFVGWNYSYLNIEDNLLSFGRLFYLQPSTA
ncbi:MAG TPA: DUF5677 domain-containing protein [bacterium]|jgi:hypothetical protein